ncbi:MAG: glutamate-1-semialdehyde 2,1-aminomutase [Planctomycetota bacterium]
MSDWFERARKCIPGGVNSPVRAYRGMGIDPVFLARAEGPYVWDHDDKRYVDYVMSYGPHILGHRHPAIDEALAEAIRGGTSFGAPTRQEVLFAEEICEAVDSVEMVRLVNSGTEAVMSALRLVRAATGRDRIIKFEGCYHGHADGFLVRAGSGALTHGNPDSPGVPAATAELTTIAKYNDLESVRKIFADQGDPIAAVFVEPIAGNIGLVEARAGFLQGLRDLCDQNGALLCFDEVMTGFRVALGGAQQLYGVKPDLTTLGKIIGGGLPVGAYGGRRDLMEQISPLGPVYQAGTLSGNPLAVAAGRAALAEIKKPGFYDELEKTSARIAEALLSAASKVSCPLVLNRVGAMFCPYFAEQGTEINNFDDVLGTDRERHQRFFVSLIKEGVMPAPSPFEAWFASAAHDDEAIEHTHRAAQKAFKAALDAN